MPWPGLEVPDNPTFVQFVALHEYFRANVDSFRNGQAAYEALHALRPRLASRLFDEPDGIDPYYVDDNLGRFFTWVAEHWDDPDPT